MCSLLVLMSNISMKHANRLSYSACVMQSYWIKPHTRSESPIKLFTILSILLFDEMAFNILMKSQHNLFFTFFIKQLSYKYYVVSCELRLPIRLEAIESKDAPIYRPIIGIG